MIDKTNRLIEAITQIADQNNAKINEVRTYNNSIVIDIVWESN